MIASTVITAPTPMAPTSEVTSTSIPIVQKKIGTMALARVPIFSSTAWRRRLSESASPMA